MFLAELVATSSAVQASSGRLDKTRRIAEMLSRLEPDEVEIAVAFLSGGTRQGRVGVGGASIRSAAETTPAEQGTLTLGDVDAAFAEIASARGGGSTRSRSRRLTGLLARATAAEQDFLTRLLFGELRQGALEGVVVEAVAKASGIAPERIRRAAMMSGDLAPVARAALVEGEPALARFTLETMRPIQPMLAESADDLREALADAGDALVEQKIDGARIQVHRVQDEVRVFTRNLRDVTDAVPEVVEIVRRSRAKELILDGEVVSLKRSGVPQPFQITMRRFGRRLDVENLRSELPLTPFFFDCMALDGTSLLDEPLERRIAALDSALETTWIVPRIVRPTPEEAEAFLERTLAAGHEGVMVKALAAPYAAGRRGAAWIKVKRAHTLDLVVLAAEWGSGRRRGWLSNLHLGARDDERGGFVMLGKTFKGMTDELLTWQTRELIARETHRDSFTVYVRPELVVEIAFNDLQASPHYPGSLALRFARVKGYRPDKTAADADSFATVQRVYRQMTGEEAPPRLS
jgi:DNA ligase-1